MSNEPKCLVAWFYKKGISEFILSPSDSIVRPVEGTKERYEVTSQHFMDSVSIVGRGDLSSA